ncbi:hypothetical protein B566_EDAN013939, partial [Ephemera danica]
MAFSLPRNAHKLLNVTSDSEGSIPALHGIRTLSMAWVINSHVLMYFLFYSGLIDRPCVVWGWYLGVDTQLYIVAAAILLLYVNGYSRSAIAIGGALLTGSWIAVATVSYVAEFIPSVKQP